MPRCENRYGQPRNRRRRPRSTRSADAAASLDRLGVGDIVVVPEGRRGGLAVVVEASREGRPPGPLVVTEQRRLRRLTTVDVPDPVEPILRIKLPKGFLARNPHSRRDIAAAMRSAVPHLPPSDGRAGARRMPAHLEEQITELRRRMRAHPAMAVRTASTTPAGPSAGGGWSARTPACAAASRAGPTRWRRPSTGSASCSWPGAISRRAGRASPPTGPGCSGSTPSATCSPRSACVSAPGGVWTRRAWPPPCRCSSTSRAATRRTRPPRMPNEGGSSAP